MPDGRVPDAGSSPPPSSISEPSIERSETEAPPETTSVPQTPEQEPATQSPPRPTADPLRQLQSPPELTAPPSSSPSISGKRFDPNQGPAPDEDLLQPNTAPETAKEPHSQPEPSPPPFQPQPAAQPPLEAIESPAPDRLPSNPAPANPPVEKPRARPESPIEVIPNQPVVAPERTSPPAITSPHQPRTLPHVSAPHMSAPHSTGAAAGSLSPNQGYNGSGPSPGSLLEDPLSICQRVPRVPRNHLRRVGQFEPRLRINLSHVSEVRAKRSTCWRKERSDTSVSDATPLSRRRSGKNDTFRCTTAFHLPPKV